jgi:hypothetical protein
LHRLSQIFSCKVVFFLFAFLFVIQPRSSNCLAAQASDSAPSTAGKTSPWQWSFAVRNRTGFRLHEPRVFQMSRTLLDVKGIYKFNDEWRLTMEGRAHYDPVERLGYPNKPWFDARQFLLDGKIKGVGLSLGLQQVVWGQADGLRVLDVINPLDYREFILEDFLDSRRPLWTVRADVPVGGGSLQLLWIPYFAPGRLPAPENEFGLGASFGLSLIAAAFEDVPIVDLPFRVESTRRPAYRLRSGQAGARYSRSVGRWDLTANYFYGWEDVPTPYLSGFDETTLELIIAPGFDRKAVYGGTAATNFGPVVLRMEAGWNARRSTPVTTFPPTTGFETFGQFSSVVGADYSFRPWLWLSGQYFLQFTSAPERELVFPRYNHRASFYARGDFWRETLKPELFILTGLNQRQYMIRPKVTRSFGDHWSFSVSADFFGGRAITPFGFFSTRDRVVVELKWLK